MGKVNLVIAAEIYPPEVGGPASFVKRLSPELAKSGYNIKIITYCNKVILDDGVIGILKTKNLFFRYLKYFISLFKIARKSDLIFAQGPIASGFPAAVVSILLNKKLIIKIVGDVVWERAVNKKQTTLLLDDFQKMKQPFKIRVQQKIRNWAISKAYQIIVPSYYLKSIVLDWNVSEKKIKVIYNSFREVNKKEFNNLNNKQQGINLLYVGRLTPWKGLKTLIDLMPALLSFNNEVNFTIVGDGPMEEALKLKVKDLELEGKIIFTGRLAPEDISAYYKNSDVFILNSGYEGLPHVLLEALSYNLLVIASDRGGNSELIKNGENGFLVEYDNKEQILNCLKKIWQESDLTDKFSNYNKEFLQQFSFDKMLKNYLEILR